jgi:hypothetical protein
MYLRYEHLIGFLLTIALTTACSVHEEETTAQDEVTFAAGVIGKYATRLSQDGSQWTEGDPIGIYSFATGTTSTAHFSNITYTAGATAAATVFNAVNEAITYPKDGSAVDFTAYYPYQPTMSDDLYPINLSDQAASLVAHDLLYATSNNGGSGYTAGTISLEFTHQLTKIIINLVDNETGAPLTPDAEGTLIGGMNTSANFDLKSGILSGAATPADIVPHVNGSGIEAILLPFTVAADHKVTIMADGNQFLWPLNDKFGGLEMRAGYSYTFKVTVNTSEVLDVELVQFDGSSITPWADGGSDAQAPQEPSEPGNPEEVEEFDIPSDYTVISLTPGDNDNIRTAIEGATAAKVAIKLAAGNYTEANTIKVPAAVKSLLIIGEVGATKPIITTTDFITFPNGDIDLLHIYNVELAGTDVTKGYFSNHNNSTNIGAIGRLTFEHCIVHDFRGIIRVRTAIEIGTFQILNSIFHRVQGYNVLHLENENASTPVIELSKSTFYHLSGRCIHLNKQTKTSDVTIDQCTFHQGPYYAIVQFSTSGGTLHFTKNLIGAAFDISDTSVASHSDARGISVISNGTLATSEGNFYASNTVWYGTEVGSDCGFSTAELFANPAGLDFTQSKVNAGDPRWY